MVHTAARPPAGTKRNAQFRRAFLAAHLSMKNASVLEVGALDYPTFQKGEGDVFFADYFPREHSRAALAGQPAHNVDELVDVDFILEGKTLAEAAGRKFHLVIANHVIEHVPDVITWLRQISEVTPAGGALFLSVPDRRFTFDYFRYPNDAIDMVRAFEEKRTKPSAYSIMRHLYYFTPLRGPEAWAQKYPEQLVPRIGFADAVKAGHLKAKEYTDVHSWVFTDETFAQVIGDLFQGGYIPWKIEALGRPQQNQNEFHVLMKKG